MSEPNTVADEARVEEHRRPPMGERLTSRSTWIRFVFMCIAAVLLWLAGLVGVFVVIGGYLWVLFTGEVNEQLRSVGASLAEYVRELVRYLTYNSDERPFPLGGDWPSGYSVTD